MDCTGFIAVVGTGETVTDEQEAESRLEVINEAMYAGFDNDEDLFAQFEKVYDTAFHNAIHVTLNCHYCQAQFCVKHQKMRLESSN